MDGLQKEAASATVEPGTYVVRIKSGYFCYGDERSKEAFVLLWIHGGEFTNLKTNVRTSATWTSLNGFDDTVTLEVHTPTTISALLLDVYEEDNSGEITVTILDA